MCFGVARWSLGGARGPRGLPGGCPMVIGALSLNSEVL